MIRLVRFFRQLSLFILDFLSAFIVFFIRISFRFLELFKRFRQEIVTGLLGGLVVTAIAWVWLFHLSDRFFALDFREQWDIGIKIGGGVLVLAGFALTAWRITVSDRQAKTASRQVQAIEDGQVTERFTRAVAQLGERNQDGSPNLEVRLGGVYALERLAKDSSRDRWTVMEVLSAYVRENAPWREHEDPEEFQQEDRAKEGSSEGEEAREESQEGSELQVRPRVDVQAALTVIGRRLAEEEEELGWMAVLTLIGRWSTEEDEPERIDFRGADLRGADLSSARLREAHLEGANLKGANLKGANLARANLTGANLRGALLAEANLREANLERANLKEANLEWAFLKGMNLRGAILLGANLEGAQLWGVNLTGARLEGANLKRAQLIERANLARANLERVNLEWAVLIGANLTGAYLVGANLQGAVLIGANLQGAALFGANLTGANLREADLQGADLEEANLNGTRLTSARSITFDQLAEAFIDEETKLPEDLMPRKPELLERSKENLAKLEEERKKSQGRRPL